MTRGTIVSYDAEDESGYIEPDEDDDRIPFDRDSLANYPDGVVPKAGERVSFQVEGGLAGLWATHVKRLEKRSEA